MDFQEYLEEAAHRADEAAKMVVNAYRQGEYKQEDDMTAGLAILVKRELEALNETVAGRLKWSASVLKRKRGRGAEESASGADLLIHVQLRTATLKYSKGVLVQAKRVDRGESTKPNDRIRLVKQCNDMLSVTPAAYVINYTKHEMRCASAIVVAGATSRNLYDQCVWTSYRFF
jgi:hypothetical protein